MLEIRCINLEEWHALDANSYIRDIYSWHINFMGPFPISSEYLFILIVVDYISKWIAVAAHRNND